MNCQNFESIVNDLVRNQMMEAGAREQAQLHSSTCASCGARLQQEQSLTLGLRELTTSMRSENASDESEARVVSAFRDHHASLNSVISAPAAAASHGFNRGNRHYWNYAAAAGILLAVALGLAATWIWPSNSSLGVATGPSGHNPVAQVSPEKGAAAALAVASGMPLPPAAPISQDSRPLRKGLVKPSTSRTRLAKHGRSSVTVQSLNILAPAIEVTTEFIPIGFSNAANVQEGGQVVRLEMSRYAMARFGVPFNEERYAEMVKADVWVGADGLACAIRFVQ